ncbi:hypothetical protein SLS58_004968 [Diplodia intermedia]|uniref:Autophagy-related protein 16 domain-containing protein n=1 Tax=Diplodia intermedia TaxID=856260 RepID=A0ABR3TSQ0_9PEZI
MLTKVTPHTRKKNKCGLTGPNKHKGRPCPNVPFPSRWWRDIGGSHIGETNWNKSKIQSLEATNRQLQTSLTDTGNACENQQIAIEQLAARQNELTEDLTNVKRQLQSATSDLVESRRHVKDLKDEVEDLDDQIEDLEDANEDLRDRLRGPEKHRSSHRDDSKRYNNRGFRSRERETTMVPYNDPPPPPNEHFPSSSLKGPHGSSEISRTATPNQRLGSDSGSPRLGTHNVTSNYHYELPSDLRNPGYGQNATASQAYTPPQVEGPGSVGGEDDHMQLENEQQRLD